MTRPLRLATRSSPLALWQARWVASLLRRAHPTLRVVLVPLTSSGDRDRGTALYESSTVGLFVKEIQAAVLSGVADAGVHSCKDLPTTSPAGLILAATPPRADVRDCLIGATVASLPPRALVGSSSLRRRHQLALLRPDLTFTAIRGNVDTRLRKVATGEVQATMLAAAGLRRLGLGRGLQVTPLDPWSECVPAPAQGAVALDCRSDDPGTRRLLAAIDHQPTRTAITLERTVLAALEGGCSLPLGCYAHRVDARWRLVARLAPGDGTCRACDLSGPALGLADQAIRAMRGG